MAFQTATNPDTGERLVLVNDAWKPIEKSATNDAGAKAYLVGGNWLTEDMAKEVPSGPRSGKFAPILGIMKGVGDVMYGGQELVGKGLEFIGAKETGQAIIEDAARRRAIEEERIAPYREKFPMGTGAGEITGQVLGTLPIGGALSAPFRGVAAMSPTAARVATPVAEALSSGGFRTGVSSIPANIALRGGAGAVTGGAAAGIINPEDAETGALVGAAVPLALPAIAKGVARSSGWLTDLMKGRLPEVKAGAIARATLGDDLPAAVNALANAKPGITATQALADAGINADPFMALGELAKKNDVSSWYRLLGEAQQAAQKNQLALTAGGPTQAAARAASDEAINQLNRVTAPMRETELGAANIARDVRQRLEPTLGQRQTSMVGALQGQGRAATDAAQAGVRAETGAPGFLTQGTRAAESDVLADTMGVIKSQRGAEAGFIQRQIDSLAAHGLKPIDTDTIVGNITSKLNDPKIGPSDVNQAVLGKVASKIQEWTAKGGGVIDANALYSIRKNAIGEEIARLYPNVDAKQQAKYAAKLLSEVKPLIDDAIETAGGTGWRRYLNTFETGMKGVEQNQMGADALRMFNDSPKEFIKLMKNESPKAVEDIFGPGSYDIIKEMGRKSAPMEDVARQLQRDINIKEQGAAGTGGLKRIMESEQSLFRRIPAFFSRTTTTANMALDVLEGKVNEKTFALFEKGFKSGKNAVELLKELPTVERNQVLNLLKNSSKWSAGVTRGAGVSATEPRNNLAPENRNALRP
jgi:hypothetical protein